MIDMGITNKCVLERLKEINIDPAAIDVIFVTHEHIDHIKGLKVFLKKYKPTVITREKTYHALSHEIDTIEYINNEYSFRGLDFEVIKTSHDAADSIGFIISNQNQKLVHITDSGYLKQEHLTAISNANFYLLESNYEYEKLISNERYPFLTRQRIMSDEGHLSNEQCSDYLKQIIGENTSKIAFAHLSENNNTPEDVLNWNQDLAIEKIVLEKEEVISIDLGEI